MKKDLGTEGNRDCQGKRFWGNVLIWMRGGAVLTKIVLLCIFLMPWALVVLALPNAERFRNAFCRISSKGMGWFISHINGAKLVVKGKIDDEDEACLWVVAQHASLLDVPAVMELRPKVAVMAKKYVSHNLLYGMTAKALGMFSVSDGYENVVDEVEKFIKNGYCVAIFPEGSRTKDGELHRFHKGAFYIAEKLGLTIQPIFIYGTFNVLNRNEFKLYSHPIYVEVMDKITKDDMRFGKDYRSRTKAVELLFREKMAEYKNKETNMVSSVNSPFIENKLKK
ncbi:MAG: 1-acyl-sn-glycerol-3-phosphate acyltransferase [Paludibacteraceae bacterium]|nr:1-acyl-sn-glycerol-3-phosphate acyltransferase [Paludibacteraceae bacterium]